MDIKEFSLGSVNWNIKINNERLKDLNLLGLTEYKNSTITLFNENLNIDVVELTFYHELIHAFLDTLDRTDLSTDEHLVQSLAILLHQFEKTKK